MTDNFTPETILDKFHVTNPEDVWRRHPEEVYKLLKHLLSLNLQEMVGVTRKADNGLHSTTAYTYQSIFAEIGDAE